MSLYRWRTRGKQRDEGSLMLDCGGTGGLCDQWGPVKLFELSVEVAMYAKLYLSDPKGGEEGLEVN
jgi:hypothetical protein